METILPPANAGIKTTLTTRGPNQGGHATHELLPGVHRVFSLAERWLLGTHQGGVQAGHLQEYLDEFVFRWNRRHAANRGLLFMRLLEHAVTADPMPYNALVRTGIGGDEELPVPIIHSKPGTLEISPTGRPWRTSHAIAA